MPGDVLEEEDTKDVDYFIDLVTVDILEDNGLAVDLVQMLRSAIGSDRGRRTFAGRNEPSPMNNPYATPKAPVADPDQPDVS